MQSMAQELLTASITAACVRIWTVKACFQDYARHGTRDPKLAAQAGAAHA